ncbi:hypothetical protein PVAND_017112 [Polypedilum vanderplanki]|uniref:AMP-dependent synthetase/ligase domain-containing protein n=1 Tax=Polypedilum vanderplanki TaxID=319348 RepID=A0A9J6BHA8_POLVA|nr:hypothetical protein PVAND_017112 [Polypedilum vanderplanki]
MYKPILIKKQKLEWSKSSTNFNPDQNLGQLILRILKISPESVTQISADTKVSVTCGDVVGIVAANTENLAPAVFACFLLGLPVNPLAPIMIESDIVHMFSKTKPKLILCDENCLKIVQML